jgi:long-chain acyl-CoA synthetase
MTLIGATIAYAESMDTVSRDLLEMKPTFIMGVPRFYEKIHDRVLESLKSRGAVSTGLFHWALETGKRRRLTLAAGKRPGLMADIQFALAGVLVYKKFRARLGGRVRFCVSGGAPLAREIAEFFHDLGVLIVEGYGLTETSPVISANREDRFRFGTVGLPLDGIDVRIGEDGEILTRSECVMKGYFNKPEETAAALEGGWFHTGDLGKLDKDGFLSITGRKKDLLVTSGGKKIATRLIEELVEQDPHILRCVLFGDGRKFVTALVVPREEALLEYAREHKIAHDDYRSLLAEPRIHAFLETRITALSANLANYERIKYFALLDKDFTQASGELTPTLKVKRDAVISRHRDLLLPFYEKEKGGVS